MKRSSLQAAFTLTELLVVIAIIGLLGALLFPTLGSIRDRADTAKCASNLRQIGALIHQKVLDNDNFYPLIEGNPNDPIHDSDAGALSLLETLRPYGATEDLLRCPADIRTANYFATTGSSYEWFSFIDGENAISPKIYLPTGTLILPPSRFPLASDYKPVHGGRRMNILFADGHVTAYTGPGVREEIERAVEN